MMQPQGYGDQFGDMMLFPFSELSDIDDIPEQSSCIGLDMLDELPDIRDTEVTTIMIEDASYMVPKTSFTTCSEIYLASPSCEFGALTSSISIPPTDSAFTHRSSLLNLRQPAVAAAAPQLSNFLREPFTAPSIECDPPSYFSPADDHENLQPADPRPGRQCAHDEVRVRVKVVSDHERTSKKAKVVVIAEDSGGALNGVAKSKKRSRVVSNVEHVVRERQRREDTTGKYNILESMLPPSPLSKRERAVIVVDAILFLKDLQHRKQELLDRRSQMKHLESLRVGVQPRAVLAGTGNNVTKFAKHEQGIHRVNRFSSARKVSRAKTMSRFGSEDHRRNGAAATNSISPCDTDDIMNHGQRHRALHSISTGVNEIPIARRRICRTMIQAHGSGLLDDDEIQIEVVCRQPGSDFQSLLIQSVESLSLEVRYCSFSTLQPQQYMQCIVTAKVHSLSHPYFHCPSSSTTDQGCDSDVEEGAKRQNEEGIFFIISRTIMGMDRWDGTECSVMRATRSICPDEFWDFETEKMMKNGLMRTTLFCISWHIMSGMDPNAWLRKRYG